VVKNQVLTFQITGQTVADYGANHGWLSAAIPLVSASAQLASHACQHVVSCWISTKVPLVR
jgi:predicted RNA methylase